MKGSGQVPNEMVGMQLLCFCTLTHGRRSVLSYIAPSLRVASLFFARPTSNRQPKSATLKGWRYTSTIKSHFRVCGSE
jgi:hypothetical protein